MATTDIPVGTMQDQVQNSLPTNSDATIMDDTVMIMDGAGLMGGKTVTQPVMRQRVVNYVPRAIIKIRR